MANAGAEYMVKQVRIPPRPQRFYGREAAATRSKPPTDFVAINAANGEWKMVNGRTQTF